MPANLTPQYLEAESRYKQATTAQEKLAALEEMLSTIPKHKGTEKMQADIKRRIARLRAESQKRGGAAKHKPFYHVEREGAGQVVLVGPPNSGKSQLLAAVTEAEPEVADYPFTTRVPLPGMMKFEDIQIQLVDMPPLAPGLTEPWLFGIIRNADAVLLVIDLSDDDLLTEMETTLSMLSEAKIALDDKAAGDATVRKKTILIGNKIDAPSAADNLEILKEFYCDRLSILPVSAKEGTNLDALRRRVFDLLGVIRVYTKAPGKKANMTAPFVLKKGSTVIDAASAVHRDFVHQLKFARIWGSDKFDGQMVERTHALEDGDILELHV